ncbi:MAG: metallophosphoesterase family protein [Kiritimatiellae bacterium]|nr:metallophosphoesterase family protein [Kiritimatiellia bacterium]
MAKGRHILRLAKHRNNGGEELPVCHVVSRVPSAEFRRTQNLAQWAEFQEQEKTLAGKVFAVLGDIHANIEALNVVLDDARKQGVTDFVCVGDVVGYNASPKECLEIVRGELNAHCVQGNHDYYISNLSMNLEDFSPHAAAAVKWTREQLNDDEMAYLANLPLKKPVMGFTLVHSTLDMPERWGYVFENDQATSSFAFQKTPICFHGHTHVPIVYELTDTGAKHRPAEDMTVRVGQRLFINVGSVGQPRDGDPRASYAIYVPATRELKFRRLEYDVAAAQERIKKAGLPERLWQRLEFGR